jgi:hypothetical protein
MRPVLRRRFHPGELARDRPTPIDRYLGRDDHARTGHWTPAPRETVLAGIEVELIVTGIPTKTIEPRKGATTIWHVLWVGDDASGTVTVDGHTWPVAPGDSIVAPPESSLRADGGQLAVAIAVPGADASLAPPTHGDERFHGYNRQTICCRVGEIRLCRWKLTQPLDLAEHHPAPALVLALARDSVVRTATSIDRLAQGELAAVDPAARPVVTPDGLSYLLTIDRAWPAGRP